MHSKSRFFVALGIGVPVLLLGLASCGDAGVSEHGRGVEIIEEDGVRFVLNHDPALPAGAWHVEATPRLQIGEVEGEEPYLFRNVLHAHLGDDGNVLVLDAGASVIRIYSDEGVHLSSHGGRGQGPGEFQNVLMVWRLPGDTVVFAEFPGNRVSYFSGTGEFARLWTSPMPPWPYYSLVGERLLWVLSPPQDPTRQGQMRPALHVVAGTASSIGTDTLAALPGAETLMIVGDGGFSNTQVPFVPATVHGTDGASRFFHSGEGTEIVVLSLDGAPELRVRLGTPPRPVTDVDWRAAVQADLDGLAALSERSQAPPELLMERFRAREAAYEQMNRPSHMPAFERFLVDRAGNLWAMAYRGRGAGDEPQTWHVIDPDGRWLTTVSVPAELHVLDIGADYVLGRWADEMEVQRVRVHTLTRGG